MWPLPGRAFSGFVDAARWCVLRENAQCENRRLEGRMKPGDSIRWWAAALSAAFILITYVLSTH